QKEYTHKYLKDYFYKNWRKIAWLLNKTGAEYRFLNSARRYQNIPSNFNLSVNAEPTFKLTKEERGIGLHAFFQIGGERYRERQVKRYHFLVLCDHHFYFLPKKDWLLLEELEFTDWFTYREFENTYRKKLRDYTLDTTEVFEEEIR